MDIRPSLILWAKANDPALWRRLLMKLAADAINEERWSQEPLYTNESKA